MTTLQDLAQQIVAFRDARDWKQFHRVKEMALSLMLESAEVAELFQWKRDDEVAPLSSELKTELGKELVDVLYWVLLMAHDNDINLEAAFQSKMSENERKYPVELARGNSAKYDRLG